MSRHNTRQARPRIRSRIAVVVAGVALLSWAGPGANAFWTTVSPGGSAAAAADAVAAGATPSAAVSGGNVTLAWNASTTLAGRPVSGYAVARYAADGTKAAIGGTCAGKGPAGPGCVDQGVPTGTWYYTVTPVLGPWQGAESARSAGAAVDTTPPAAPTVTAPAYVNTTNVTAVPVGGITEPGASITLTVTDSAAPAHSVTKTVTAKDSGDWNAAVNLSFFNDGTLTYKAVATDTAGNQGTAPGTATSTKDVAVPTVTAIGLADAGTNGKNGSTKGKLDPGDNVTIQFSKALDASTICSNWTSAASGALTGDNQVTVTISSTNMLSVDVTSAACATFRLGTVALNGSYYGSGPLTYKGIGATASIVSWNPSGPAPTLTITLGALASGSPASASTTAATPSYAPANGMKDRAGNDLPTAPFTSTTASRF